MAVSPDLFRGPRAEQIANHLEERIVAERIEGGHRLGTKRELQSQYGVALPTITEALRILEAQGLVTTRPGPGGGIFVAAVSSRLESRRISLAFRGNAAPFADSLAVRNALEPMVCTEAAEHCGPEDAEILRGIVAEMEAHKDDLRHFLRCNWELHRKLVGMGPNLTLKTIYLGLLDFAENHADGRIESIERYDPDENLAVHKELVEAVIAGDRKKLQRAIKRHTPIAVSWVELADDFA